MPKNKSNILKNSHADYFTGDKIWKWHQGQACLMEYVPIQDIQPNSQSGDIEDKLA